MTEGANPYSPMWLIIGPPLMIMLFGALCLKGACDLERARRSSPDLPVSTLDRIREVVLFILAVGLLLGGTLFLHHSLGFELFNHPIPAGY
jgi:hypothetical protein